MDHWDDQFSPPVAVSFLSEAQTEAYGGYAQACRALRCEAIYEACMFRQMSDGSIICFQEIGHC